MGGGKHLTWSCYAATMLHVYLHSRMLSVQASQVKSAGKLVKDEGIICAEQSEVIIKPCSSQRRENQVSLLSRNWKEWMNFGWMKSVYPLPSQRQPWKKIRLWQEVTQQFYWAGSVILAILLKPSTIFLYWSPQNSHTMHYTIYPFSHNFYSQYPY